MVFFPRKWMDRKLLSCWKVVMEMWGHTHHSSEAAANVMNWEQRSQDTPQSNPTRVLNHTLTAYATVEELVLRVSLWAMWLFILVMIHSCLNATIFLKCDSNSYLCRWNWWHVSTYQGAKEKGILAYTRPQFVCCQNFCWNPTQSGERGEIYSVLCPGKLSVYLDPLYF